MLTVKFVNSEIRTKLISWKNYGFHEWLHSPVLRASLLRLFRTKAEVNKIGKLCNAISLFEFTPKLSVWIAFRHENFWLENQVSGYELQSLSQEGVNWLLWKREISVIFPRNFCVWAIFINSPTAYGTNVLIVL
jgi:hypothetical protein